MRRANTSISTKKPVTFSATALSSLAPGSAAQLILGDYATPEQIAQLNAQYGYDLPVWQHPRVSEYLQTLPHRDGTEGFFVARLRRQGGR